MSGPEVQDLNEEPSCGPNRGGVDPRGPVFLSHRRSDGGPLANNLAWELRAFGVPVWHDVTDLPPGDTRRRLEEALTGGLSGSVLIVTPEIQHSEVVREIELPRLIDLEEHSEFTFAIASIVNNDGGQLDYGAADDLLHPSKSLSSFLYLPARDMDEVAEVARQVAIQRMAVAKRDGRTELVVDIQSRRPPAAASGRSDLVIRMRPPRDGEHGPPPATWPSLRRGLAALPELVDRSGATAVLIRGGAHLTIAFAVGTALPETAPWPVCVLDQFGNRWGEPGGTAQMLETTTEPLSGPGPPAVFVDMVPSPEPANTFGLHVAQGGYRSATRITLTDRPPVDPSRGEATTRAIAEQLRLLAHETETIQVALFLRCPFALALLLGRLLNTLSLDLYEWDGAAHLPAYIRTITVSSGRGGSPITNIHHVDSEEPS